MRHVQLTCKNHPNLRWSCKSIAYTPGHGYNVQRRIFFEGWARGAPVHPDAPATECSCSSRNLVLAPEDEWSKLPIDKQKAAIQLDTQGC